MFVRNSAQIVATGGQKVSFSIASSRQLITAVDGRIHNIFVSGIPERALVDMDCLRHYIAHSYAVVRGTEETISVHIMQGLLGGMEEPRREGPQLNRQELLRFARQAIVEAEKARNKEVVVFMGDTGAGKSTLISALSGIQMEQAGAVVRAAPGYREVAPMQRAENEGRVGGFIIRVYLKEENPQAEHHFVDCGGFGDTNLIPEKKIIVPLSAALTLRNAEKIRFVLCINWGALNYQQGKPLIKLMETVYDSLGSLITPEQSEAISRQTILLFTRTDGRVTRDEALQRANTIYTNKSAIWREKHGEEDDGEAIPPLPLRCLKNIIDQGNILAVDVLDVEAINQVKQAISRIPKIENPQSVFRLPQGEVRSILNDIMADVVRGKDLYSQLKRAQAASIAKQKKWEETDFKIRYTQVNIEEQQRRLAGMKAMLDIHVASGEDRSIYHTLDTGFVRHQQLKTIQYSCPLPFEDLVFDPPANNPGLPWHLISTKGFVRVQFLSCNVRGREYRRGSIQIYVKNKSLPSYQQQTTVLNTDIANCDAHIQSLREENHALAKLKEEIEANISSLERGRTTNEEENIKELDKVYDFIAFEREKFAFAYQFLSLVDDPEIRVAYPVIENFMSLYQEYNQVNL